MGGGQLVHTVCMDTRDALRREEGEFTMRLGGDNPRFQAVKLVLGSLEFPMVQWTIEEAWNRLYLSEGYRLGADTCWLRLSERAGDDASELVATLPMHLNEIVRMQPLADDWVLVKTASAHGLWVGARKPIFQAIWWADIEILCSSLGRVSLHALAAADGLAYVSEDSFRMRSPGCGGEVSGGGFLHTPAYPSPSALCDALGFALAYADTLASYDVRYDAASNRASLRATLFPPEQDALTVRLYGSGLAALLGYPSAVHERVFRKGSGGAPGGYDFYGGRGDALPLVLPSEPFGGWLHAALQPGWYAPSQRPMCTGKPLSLLHECEIALNRFYFPTPDRVPQGMPTAHFLMFADPGGTLHNCPVYAGRYSAEGLAAALEAGMSRLCHRTLPGTTFTVEYVDERFVFTCEVRGEDGTVRAAPFALHLHHPAQFDPARIGFPAAALSGRDTYTSARIAVPSPSRPLANIYEVSEVTHQKRICVQCVAPPQMCALITDYDAASRTLHVHTYSGQIPCAHGMRAGDLVCLSPSHDAELFRFGRGDSEWTTETARTCPVAPLWGCNGVVVDAAAGRDEPMPNVEQVRLALRVKHTPELADHIGRVLTVSPTAEPFNLCFGLPQSVPCTHLGFGPGATQWGVDGAVLSGGVSVPPFEAPAVHALDHPDYVLIYIDDGKKATGLQHQSGRHTTAPFAKLVLYPMFREERMLPRETTLLAGESLSQFTLRFCNPDGSPYHFHGAHLSFSLSFIRVQDA